MNNDTIQTGKFLLKVHSGLKENFGVFKEQNVNRKQIALDLEEFFNRIKNQNQEDEFFCEEVRKEFYKKLRENLNYNINNLYKYSGNNPNEAGAQTEKEIQDIYNSFLSAAFPEICEKLVKKTLELQNKEQTNEDKNDLLLIKGDIGATSGGVGRRQSKKDKNYITSRNYVKRWIKTDFYAEDIFKILGVEIPIGLVEYGLTEKGANIFNYLSKYRFTIKASKNFAAAKVGTTDPEKAFMAIAGACTNYGEAALYGQYRRLLNSFYPPDTEEKHTSNAEIIKHGLHIRAAYELTGLGLLDIKQRKEITDFLIVSNDNGKIEVYDTHSLIMDFIDGNNNKLFTFSSNIRQNPFVRGEGKNKTSISIHQARKAYKTVKISSK